MIIYDYMSYILLHTVTCFTLNYIQLHQLYAITSHYVYIHALRGFI